MTFEDGVYIMGLVSILVFKTCSDDKLKSCLDKGYLIQDDKVLVCKEVRPKDLK